jgi:hypothetical protein
MDLAVLAGRPTKLVLGEDSRLNCDIGLELNEMAADRVEIKVPFQCDGGETVKPRLITALGQRASIRQGNKAPGSHEYAFGFVVTPWPEGTPWPQARPASAPGTPQAPRTGGG